MTARQYVNRLLGFTSFRGVLGTSKDGLATRYAIGSRQHWTIGSHIEQLDSYDVEPSTCESAVLYDATGNILADLHCIDDADANYRRVIRAELALEAMDNEQDVSRYGLVN